MWQIVIQRFTAKVTAIAAEPDDDHDLRLHKTLLLSAVIFFPPLVTIWTSIYLYFGEPDAAAVPAAYLVLSWLGLAFFLLTRRYKIMLVSQQVMILILPFLVMVFLGGYVASSAVILWSAITPLGTLVIVNPRAALRWWAAYVALLVLGAVLDPRLPDSGNLPLWVITTYFVLNIGVVSSIVFIFLYYYVNERNKAYLLLKTEQEKSERLLLNVLPKEIAPILKDNNQTIAEHFESASILFADVVGFTPLSAEMTPSEMVELLNEIFSYFDTLVEKYDLEKIRTIGDNYMVAAGVPRRRPDHAQALAEMALEMCYYLDTRPARAGRRLDFRVGINSGPVLGGVIGKTKFHYDVWGDTVNTASRMESHGLPGQIQITAATYDLLKGDYICQPRGSIQVKGKGEMETWLLIGRAEHGQYASPASGRAIQSRI